VTIRGHERSTVSRSRSSLITFAAANNPATVAARRRSGFTTTDWVGSRKELSDRETDPDCTANRSVCVAVS
jgi:hypothetical protein